MMNYRYVKSAIVDRHDVLEVPTGHLIKTGLTFQAARDLTRKLNFGAGFAGWTPEFILQPIELASE